MNWLSRIFGGGNKVAPVELSPEQLARLDAWRKLPKPDTARSHFQTRYIVADVEASGLNMVNDSLISIGAVGVTNGMINAADAFEVILRQDIVSTHENILIHGIGGSAQREGVDPVEALLRFLEYAGRAPLVAYHAEFDRRMIAKAMREYLGVEIEMQWIDLAYIMPELYRELIDRLVGLDEWMQRFDIENIQRHNAVSDSFATAKLLQVAMTRGSTLGKDCADVFVEIETARRWLQKRGGA